MASYYIVGLRVLNVWDEDRIKHYAGLPEVAYPSLSYGSLLIVK